MAFGGKYSILSVLIYVLSTVATADGNLELNQILGGADSVRPDSVVAQKLRERQPALAREIFGDRGRTIRVDDFVFLPKADSGEIPVRSVSDYEASVTRQREGFFEDVNEYLSASVESNTYWNRMTGTWRSSRGHNGKTSPEIAEDFARRRMLSRVTYMRKTLGISEQSLQEYYSIIADADAKNRELVRASYNDLTRKMYTIPIMAFAAPIVLYVAAPGAVLAGSGSLTGVGTTAVGTKVLVGTSVVGGGLGLGTDALSQTASILDGQQKNWSYSRSALSTGTGTVLLPLSVMSPPLGYAVFAESTLHGSFSAVHNVQDGHYWSAGADVTNTVVIPYAIYKAPKLFKANAKLELKNTEKTNPVPEIEQEVVATENPQPEVGVKTEKAKANSAEEVPLQRLEPQAVANAPPTTTIEVTYVNPPAESRTRLPDEISIYVFSTKRPPSNDPAVARAHAKWEIRNKDFKEITVDENGIKVVLGQDPNGDLFGISTTVDPIGSGLTGCYVKLRPGEPLPDGFVWLRDGKDVVPGSTNSRGHLTIANQVKMPLKELKRKWETWIAKIVSDAEAEIGFIPDPGVKE